MGRFQTHDAVHRRWPADRTAGIGPHPERRVRRRDADACAARRTCRRSLEIVGIQRLPAERALRRRRGKLGHVHLCQDDCPRVAQLLHDERVGGRNRAFEQDGAAGGRQIGRIVIVLEYHGNAVKRGARSLCFPFRIELSCGFDGLRVQDHDRVKRWSFAIVAAYAGEA
jgi:hypothetical protein